jgi:hypothetical protein
VHTTAWSRGLDVTAGGRGVASHAGLVLLRALADQTGLTGGLSKDWRPGGCWCMTGAGSWSAWPR